MLQEKEQDARRTGFGSLFCHRLLVLAPEDPLGYWGRLRAAHQDTPEAPQAGAVLVDPEAFGKHWAEMGGFKQGKGPFVRIWTITYI